MEPIAPDRPAGKAEQDQRSDISSLPAMSVDPDTGTGGAANATASYGELTQANLTYLDRRNQPGVADAEVAPTATTQELATLTGRMLRPSSNCVWAFAKIHLWVSRREQDFVQSFSQCVESVSATKHPLLPSRHRSTCRSGC